MDVSRRLRPARHARYKYDNAIPVDAPTAPKNPMMEMPMAVVSKQFS